MKADFFDESACTLFSVIYSYIYITTAQSEMLWAVAFIMSFAIYCKDSQNHFTVT